MDIRTLFVLYIIQVMVNTALAIPLDKELYRVKRKGIDGDEELELTRRVRRSENNQGEKERELRKKRRFFSAEEDESEISLNELYKNKMSQRSSRSSREDKDITAQEGQRFKIRNGVDSSGSGSGFIDTASGSGLWMSQDSKEEYGDLSLPKTAEKRSARINSLEKLVSALKAITIPDETESAKAGGSSASGSGEADTMTLKRKAKLSQALADVAPISGSGNEEVHQSGSAAVHIASGAESDLGSAEATIVRRELVGETLANELVEAARKVSTPDFTALRREDDSARKKRRDALDEFMEVARERRTPLPTEIDADSLVVRFYRDQEMQENEAASPASLPSEYKHDADVTEDHYSDFINTPDFTVPKVIYKKEISKYHEPIIEMPAVYSQNFEDDEMDSSDGGSDRAWDESDAPIEVHERHIEEDGYVGCYVDKSPDRDLPHAVSIAELTPDACRVACKDAGHAYAGVQYGYLCRCGDNYGKYSKVTEEECSSACKGDGSQKCGGFYRSSIYATAGATEPKRGNFFHIESIQPIVQGASYAAYPAMESGYSSGSAALYSGAQPDSSSFAVSQAPLNMAYEPFGSGAPSKYSAAVSPASLSSSDDVHPLSDSSVPITSPVPIVPFTNEAQPLIEQPENVGVTKTRSKVPKQGGFEPKGTHGSQLIYLHPQQDIVSRMKVNDAPRETFKAERGKKVFTGSVKLKQSWFDDLKNKNSAKFKILAGNVEQAFRKIFSKDPAFSKAEVLEFREGLVKHNPNTIRKVIAPFALTFKNDAKEVEAKLKQMVKGSGRLFDMPVYNDSLQVAEYAKVSNGKHEHHGIDGSSSKVEKKSMETKRDIVTKPELEESDPFLKAVFREVSK